MGDTMKSIDRIESCNLKIKKTSTTSKLCLWVVVLLLSVICLAASGCRAGETAQESRLRHKRILRVNTSLLLEDIDRFLMLDKPSGLSGHRLP